jgi:hypothetical protein
LVPGKGEKVEGERKKRGGAHRSHMSSAVSPGALWRGKTASAALKKC